MCNCFVYSLGPRILRRCLTHFNVTKSDVIVYGSIGVHFREGPQLFSKGDSTPTVNYATQEVNTVMRILKPVTHLIWKTATAQHFTFAGGHFHFPTMEDYNRWRPNATCASSHTIAEMEEHNAWNRAGQPLIRAAGVPILDVWRSTSLAWNAHVGFGDCTHWCVPGVMDHWTDPLHSLVQQRLVAFL